MLFFILRRVLALVCVLWAVVTLTFLLIRLSPGGPFVRERNIPPSIEKQLLKRYKLDGTEGRAWGTRLGADLGLSESLRITLGNAGSLGQQYFSYVGDLLHGDLRLSTKYRDRSVNEILAQTLPISMALGGIAFVIASVAGIWLGCYAAVRRDRLGDRAAMFGALGAISVPTFVTGPLAILAFALLIPIFPVGGLNGPWSIVLPALVLATPYVAYIARLMRTSMLDVLGQDFIRTARAKGLPEREVVYKHALKVAILPVVSFLGPLAANLLTGSIVVESIFNLPGMGGFFVNSILNSDGFLLGGVVIIYCTLLVGMNLVVDIAYTLLDRRIRLY
jgi:oligopeptide transport system permease protein